LSVLAARGDKPAASVTLLTSLLTHGRHPGHLWLTKKPSSTANRKWGGGLLKEKTRLDLQLLRPNDLV
jgi:hypothetical protein